MQPINLKELFGNKYRIEHDPAAAYEQGGKRDPWLFIIPCKYGHIYPHSDKLLAVWIDGSNIRKRFMDAFPDLECVNWSDTGEAIFLFPPGIFEGIAKILKPKKRPGVRKLSPEHREKLTTAGTDALKKHKKSIVLGSLEHQETIL